MRQSRLPKTRKPKRKMVCVDGIWQYEKTEFKPRCYPVTFLYEKGTAVERAETELFWMFKCPFCTEQRWLNVRQGLYTPASFFARKSESMLAQIRSHYKVSHPDKMIKRDFSLR